MGKQEKEVMQYTAGGAFGERALLRAEPRAASVIARTKVRAYTLEQAQFKTMIDNRNLKEGLIRKAALFESLDDDQVAKVAARLIKRVYRKDGVIMKQGEP